MAFYQNDVKLRKAQEFIEELNESHVTEGYELVLYYVNHLEERQRDLDNQLNEFQTVFRMMGRLIRKNNPNLN